MLAQAVKLAVRKGKFGQELAVPPGQLRLCHQQGGELEFLEMPRPAAARPGQKTGLHRRRNRLASAIGSGPRHHMAPLVVAVEDAVVLPRRAVRGWRRRPALEGVEHALIEVAAVIVRDLGIADRRDDLAKAALKTGAALGRREILAVGFCFPQVS